MANDWGDSVQFRPLTFRNGDEMPWRRSLPEPNLAFEVKPHEGGLARSLNRVLDHCWTSCDIGRTVNLDDPREPRARS